MNACASPMAATYSPPPSPSAIEQARQGSGPPSPSLQASGTLLPDSYKPRDSSAPAAARPPDERSHRRPVLPSDRASLVRSVRSSTPHWPPPTTPAPPAP